MFKYQYKVLLVAAFLVSSLGYAEVSDESLDKLLVLSGLTKQVEQFPAFIVAGMEQAHQQGAPIPEAEFSAIVSSAKESFLPSEMVAGVRASLKESIDEKEAQKILAWYESDIGKEITKAEENASTPEAQQLMMQMAQSLSEDTARVEFASRLDELVGMTDMTMDLQVNSGVAVYTAIMTVMQPDEPLDLDPIKAQISDASAQARPAINQMVTISLVYAYKDIDMAKLKKYETFLNDSDTVKFNETVMNSISRELHDSILKWADELAKILDSVN